MVPTLADIRALRRFADSVQTEPARKFLQIVKVLADGSFRAQPRGFGPPHRRPELNLNEL